MKTSGRPPLPALDFDAQPLLRWQPILGARLIDHLSPREDEDLERELRSGRGWPRVIRACFLDGTRLLLGMDRARSEAEIGAAAGIDPGSVGRAIADAARWCREHGLHLLGYVAGDQGETWRHFLAVG